MTELSEKLTFFIELLHCSAPVSFWHYDNKMNLVSCDSPQEELFHTLFAISEYRLEVYEHCQNMDVPAIITNHLSMVWLFAPFKINGTLMDIYAVGPIFYTVVSENTFQAAVNSIVAAPPVKSATRKAINDIPVISHSLLQLFATQLHYCLTGQHIHASRLQFLYPKHEKTLVSDMMVSSPPIHAPYALELELFKAVREGNIQYSIPGSLFGFTTGKLSENDPLRQVKTEVHTMVILSCRAAMEGGLNPEIAYSLSDYYIQATERATNINVCFSQ